MSAPNFEVVVTRELEFTPAKKAEPEPVVLRFDRKEVEQRKFEREADEMFP